MSRFARALFHRIITCLCAPVFALALVAPAYADDVAEFKPPAFWKGFKQVGNVTGRELQIRSWVPEADSQTDWHMAFNIYVFTPVPPGDATGAILAYMQQVAEHACGALAVDLGQTRPDPALPGYSTRYAQMFCPNAAGNGHSRVDLLKVVTTEHSVTVFTLMRQSEPFVLQLPQPPAFKTPQEAAAHDAWLVDASKYLREVARVCDRKLFSMDKCSQ